MKAAFRAREGSPDVLTYGQVPDPEIGPDTVLIQVHAISLEGGDLLNRRITPPASAHDVVGYQASGTVVAVGADVTRVRVGESVVGFHWNGSHAELFAVNEAHAYPIPEGFDLDIAATIPIAFGTASDALFEFGSLKENETVLVQGAAGGVGLAAVQLASQVGGRVIATASSAERLAALTEFGASVGINYLDDSISKVVLQHTHDQGADLIVDLAGGKSLDELMAAVRYRGRFSVVGASSGDLPSFQFMDILRKSLTLYGVFFGLEMATERAHRLIETIFARFEKGELRMPIARTFSLEDAVEAHRYAEQGHPFGRVIIKP